MQLRVEDAAGWFVLVVRVVAGGEHGANGFVRAWICVNGERDRAGRPKEHQRRSEEPCTPRRREGPYLEDVPHAVGKNSRPEDRDEREEVGARQYEDRRDRRWKEPRR